MSVADPPEMSKTEVQQAHKTVYQTKVMTDTPDDIEEEREAT